MENRDAVKALLKSSSSGTITVQQVTEQWIHRGVL